MGISDIKYKYFVPVIIITIVLIYMIFQNREHFGHSKGEYQKPQFKRTGNSSVSGQTSYYSKSNNSVTIPNKPSHGPSSDNNNNNTTGNHIHKHKYINNYYDSYPYNYPYDYPDYYDLPPLYYLPQLFPQTTPQPPPPQIQPLIQQELSPNLTTTTINTLIPETKNTKNNILNVDPETIESFGKYSSLSFICVLAIIIFVLLFMIVKKSKSNNI